MKLWYVTNLMTLKTILQFKVSRWVIYDISRVNEEYLIFAHFLSKKHTRL